MFRLIVAFVVAVVVTELGIALVNTTSVLLRLSELGIPLTAAQWADTLVADVLGIAPIFLPILGIGFAIAFAVAAAVVRWLLPNAARYGYPLAGAVCVLTIVVAVNSIFGTHPIAASRSLAGLGLLCASGAFGGLLFVRLLPARARETA